MVSIGLLLFFILAGLADIDLSAFKHFRGLITLYSRFSSQTTDSFDLNMIFSYNNES